MTDRPDHEPGTASPATPRRAFSKDDLARAAQRRLAREAQTPGRPRRRPPLWRMALWGFEAVVLLAVLEAFVLRPWWQRRHAGAAPPPSPAPVGEAAPVQGAAAPALPGLSEVVPAFLAPLAGLAEGSATTRAAQLAFSRDTGLPIEVRNSLGMRFRLVPPGTAILGSPADEAGRGDGELQHVFVAMEPFYLGTCEVTQSEWSSLMPANPSHYSGPQRPVEEVTWYDCQRFLAALCQREGVPEGTYRLPSESEWEYACRAGTATAFHCGNDPRRLDAFATHGDNGGSGTTAVGLKQPNALGLYDLHGNVWEWCLNRFAPYPNDTRPADPEYASWRCLRGGNWYVPPLDCRSAGRNRLPPTSKGNMLGFRVLRRIDPAATPATPAAPATPATPPAAPSPG